MRQRGECNVVMRLFLFVRASIRPRPLVAALQGAGKFGEFVGVVALRRVGVAV